jgi:hypothetical protein
LAVRGEASALPAAAGFDAAALPEAAVLPPQPASRPASRVSASARAKIRFFMSFSFSSVGGISGFRSLW